MLRMVKVTSPMSVGTWVLSGFGAATAPAAAHAFTRGRLGRAGVVAQVGSAALGLPLATYTAALIATTAVPAWHEARAELPFVFGGGAAASAGAALTLLSPVREAQAARRLAVGGAVVELLAAQIMERRLHARGTDAAYHEPPVKSLHRAAFALTATGAVLIAGRAGRSRSAAVAGGALVSAGALAERWAIFRAGSHSAERPRDTVEPQRARIRTGRARGAARDQAKTTVTVAFRTGSGARLSSEG
jgi:hypothetical protein